MIRKHLRRHESSPYFHVECSFCDKAFTTVRFWHNHITKHVELKFGDICGAVEVSSSLPSPSGESPTTGPVVKSTQPNSPELQQGACPEGEENYDFGKELSSLVVHLRACNMTESLCRDVVDFVGEYTAKALHTAGSPKHCSQPVSACENLLSFSNLEQAALKSYSMDKSQTVKVGKFSVEFLPITGQLMQTYDSTQPSDLLEICREGEIRGPQDGARHKDVEDGTLLLGVYYDAFQTGNPLGPHAKGQNIGAVYCGIMNRKTGGNLDDVFVSTLFPDEALKEHSWREILDPFLNELKALEKDGIKLNGVTRKVRVSMILGDNLGVHSLAGFTMCFSGGAMICRHCTMSKEEIQKATEEDKSRLRTGEQYDGALRLVREESFCAEICRDVGVHDACPLSELRDFHPSDSIPPDVMHDVFEGVAPKTIAYALDNAVSSGVATEHALRDSMITFPYSHVDTNRPTAVQLSSNKRATGSVARKRLQKGRAKKTVLSSVKQTASEAWCLLRLLPLILLHAGVTLETLSGSEWFRPIRLLIHIVQILTSFTLSAYHVECLESLISAFLKVLLASSASPLLTPKHHYMTHYASQIKRHGPLRRLWSMRFEGKHQLLKSTIKLSKNRRNVCRSIMRRYQLKSLDGFRKARTMRCFLKFKGTLPREVCQLVSESQQFQSAIVNGIRYKRGDIATFNGRFYEIICICRASEKISLLGQQMNSHYESFLGAFVLAQTTEYAMLPLSGLDDDTTMGCYELHGTKYAVPRYQLPGMTPPRA